MINLPFLRIRLDRDADGRPAALRVQVGRSLSPLGALAGGGSVAADQEERGKWVIDASNMGLRERLLEFWRYRRVLSYFSTRAVQGLYKGTTLGPFWLFARPLLPIAISAFIFGSVLDVGSDGVPYFLFFMTGNVTWMVFERGLRFVSRSFDQSKGLVKKIYFPRLIAPFASILPALVQAGVYLALFFGSLLYYLVREHHWYLVLSPRIVFALVSMFLAIFFTIAVGLWTSVWQARFQDMKYTLRYITRFWHYATPVIYPISQIPPQYRWLIYANPMAPVVETFKWATLGIGDFYPAALLCSFTITSVVFVGGVWYFGKAEASSVDRL